MKTVVMILGAFLGLPIFAQANLSEQVSVAQGRWVVISVVEADYLNEVAIRVLPFVGGEVASQMLVFLNHDSAWKPCPELKPLQSSGMSRDLQVDQRFQVRTGYGHLRMTEPHLACIYNPEGRLLEGLDFLTRRWED